MAGESGAAHAGITAAPSAAAVGLVLVAVLAVSLGLASAAPPAVEAPAGTPAGGAPAVQVSLPDPEDVLRKVIQAPLLVDFGATQVAVTWSRSGSSACVSRVIHKHPDKTRMEFMPSVEAPARIVVYAGGESYHYELGSPVVLVMRLGGATGEDGGVYAQSGHLPVRDLELVRKNFRMTVGGPGIAAGRPCWVVDVTPRHENGSRLRIWVDAATWLVLRVEKRKSDGSLEFISYLTDVTLRPEFPDGAFGVPVPGTQGHLSLPVLAGTRRRPQPVQVLRVEPPVRLPSLESAMAAVRYGLLTPGYLPEGYVFEAVQIGVRGGRPLVQALYTDGLNTLSLFQMAGGAVQGGRNEPLIGGMTGARKVRLGSGEAWVKAFGSTIVVTRTVSTLTVTVVADLDEETVVRVASSLRPVGGGPAGGMLSETERPATGPGQGQGQGQGQGPDLGDGQTQAQTQTEGGTWRTIVFRFIYRIFSVDSGRGLE